MLCASFVFVRALEVFEVQAGVPQVDGSPLGRTLWNGMVGS